MPEFVNPDETESRQSLYRDLLSHLNETIWGSPSTLPRSESGKYTLDMNPVEVFDKTKNPEGAIYAEPQLNWLESSVNRGPGWQSRTLDWLAGRLGKAPKQATAESWISKAKGAGLPVEEREHLIGILQDPNYVHPKDRVGAKALAFEAERSGLPTLGIETKILSEDPIYKAKYERLDTFRNKLVDKLQRYYDTTSPEDLLSSREYNKLFELDSRTVDRLDSMYNKAEASKPRWSQFNLEEVTSPREILYKAKGSTYKNPDIETHYPGQLGEGLQWHQREGKLKFPEGESTHLSEQQSDLASEYAKQQKIGGNQEERQRIISRIEQLRDPNSSMAQLSEDTRRTLINQLSSELMASHGNVPKPTLGENYYKTGFRDLVNRAVKEDSKFVSWDSAAVQKKRWPAGEGTDKFFDQHYDQKLVNFVKKEYGVTPEKVNVPTKVMGKVTLMSSRGENIERPTTSLTMWRVKPEEAPDETLRWVVGDPDFGTYSHYGTYQEAKEALDWLIKRGVETKNNEVWRIPVTDEMKRKVLLEGQYFSKKDEATAFRRPYEIG